MGWDLGFETEIGLLENGEVVAGRDLVGLKRKLVYYQMERLCPDLKKGFQMANNNKQFPFMVWGLGFRVYG